MLSHPAIAQEAVLGFELGMTRPQALNRVENLTKGDTPMTRRDVHLHGPASDLPHETFLTAVTLSDVSDFEVDRLTIGLLPPTAGDVVYLLQRETSYSIESAQAYNYVVAAVMNSYGEPTIVLGRGNGVTEKRWIRGEARACPNRCRVVVDHPYFGHAIYDPTHFEGYVSVAEDVDRIVTAVLETGGDGKLVKRVTITAIDLRLRADAALADLQR